MVTGKLVALIIRSALILGGAWRAVSPAAKFRRRIVSSVQKAANWRHPAQYLTTKSIGTLHGLLNVSAE